MWLIAITAAIFVIGFLSPEMEATIYRTLALVRPPGAIIAGQIVDPAVYRIFTVALVHGGLMHVLFNMYALYLFGPRLEQQVGSAAFATIYAASAAAGGFFSITFGGEGGWAVGASGAIFGLFGAWMFVAWKMRHSPGGRAMFNQLGVLMAINILLPFLVPGIDWLGHFGGFVAGVAIAALWSVFAVGKENARTVRTLIGVGAIVVITAATFFVI
jgi:membrane associated rhomboid family serine protease